MSEEKQRPPDIENAMSPEEIAELHKNDERRKRAQAVLPDVEARR